MIVEHDWCGVIFQLEIPKKAYDVLELTQRLLPNFSIEPSPDNLRAIFFYLENFIIDFSISDAQTGKKITKEDIPTIEFLDNLPEQAIISVCNKLLKHAGYEQEILDRFNQAFQQLYLAEPCKCGFCQGKTSTRKANCAVRDIKELETNILIHYLTIKDDPITESVPYWQYQLKNEAQDAQRKFNRRQQELKRKEEDLRQKLRLKK